MKCPKCNEEMWSTDNTTYDFVRGVYVEHKYVCPKCGYEAKDTTEGLKTVGNYVPEYQYKNYGWLCPKCGAVLSPSTTECPHCTPYKTTCGTIGDIKTVLTDDVTSQTQVYKGYKNMEEEASK